MPAKSRAPSKKKAGAKKKPTAAEKKVAAVKKAIADDDKNVKVEIATAAGDSKNPYSLAKVDKKAPPAAYLAKTYTDKDRAAMLEGYVEIPPDLWPNIKLASHVRYVLKTGEFRPGGFMLTACMQTKGSGDEMKSMFMLQNNFNRSVHNYAKWPVAYDSVAHMYVKGDVTTIVLQRQLASSIEQFNARLKKIVEILKGKKL